MATHRQITRHVGPGDTEALAVLVGKAQANLADPVPRQFGPGRPHEGGSAG